MRKTQMELRPRVFRAEFHYRLVWQFGASLVFCGRKRGPFFFFCVQPAPRIPVLPAETSECLSSSLQVIQRQVQGATYPPRELTTSSCSCMKQWLGWQRDGRRNLLRVGTMPSLCSLNGGAWKRGDKPGGLRWICSEAEGAQNVEQQLQYCEAWGARRSCCCLCWYLGGERLPVPQPTHRRPGFAGRRAAPAQVRPYVGFRVRDHLQPLGLSCKGAREGGRAKRIR